MTVAGWVEAWQEDDGLWRWRYVDHEGVDLLSNESHVTRDQAIHAASVAYPEVRVEVRSPDEPAEGKRPGKAAILVRALLLLLAATAALPVGVVLLWRRLRRAIRR